MFCLSRVLPHCRLVSARPAHFAPVYATRAVCFVPRLPAGGLKTHFSSPLDSGLIWVPFPDYPFSLSFPFACVFLLCLFFARSLILERGSSHLNQQRKHF